MGSISNRTGKQEFLTLTCVTYWSIHIVPWTKSLLLLLKLDLREYLVRYFHHAEENLLLEGRQICQGHTAELSSNAFVTLCIQTLGFPGVSVSKESSYNTGDAGSIPGWRRSSWRRKWQPTPVFLPGELHGTEEPGGLQSMGLRESFTT